MLTQTEQPVLLLYPSQTPTLVQPTLPAQLNQPPHSVQMFQLAWYLRHPGSVLPDAFSGKGWSGSASSTYHTWWRCSGRYFFQASESWTIPTRQCCWWKDHKQAMILSFLIQFHRLDWYGQSYRTVQPFCLRYLVLSCCLIWPSNLAG